MIASGVGSAGVVAEYGALIANTPPTILTDVTRYTVKSTDGAILSNCASELILTLPNAATCSGRTLSITACTLMAISSANADVYPIGVVVLMNSTIIPAGNQGKWVVLQSNGVGWLTIAAG